MQRQNRFLIHLYTFLPPPDAAIQHRSSHANTNTNTNTHKMQIQIQISMQIQMQMLIHPYTFLPVAIQYRSNVLNTAVQNTLTYVWFLEYLHLLS